MRGVHFLYWHPLRPLFTFALGIQEGPDYLQYQDSHQYQYHNQ